MGITGFRHRHPDLLQLGNDAGVGCKLATKGAGSEVCLLQLGQLKRCFALQVYARRFEYAAQLLEYAEVV